MTIEFPAHPGCIELSDGSTLLIRCLDQYYTYAGVTEGIPDDSLNDHLVKRALAELRSSSSVEPNIVFIEPERRSSVFEHRVRNLAADDGARSFISRHTAEFIPVVQCSIRADLITEPGLGYDLGILWYEHAFVAQPPPHVCDAVVDADKRSMTPIDWEAI